MYVAQTRYDDIQNCDKRQNQQHETRMKKKPVAYIFMKVHTPTFIRYSVQVPVFRALTFIIAPQNDLRFESCL